MDAMKVRSAAIIAFLLCTSPVHSQSPRGTALLSQRAVADSSAVLVELDRRVRAQPGDAAAWYRRGVVALALSDRAVQPPPIKELDATRLGRLADSSLRIAVSLDSKNARYRLTLGQMLMRSGIGTARVAGASFLTGAVERARTGSDRGLHAEVAVAAGRVYWGRYDALANRVLNGDPRRSVNSAAGAGQCQPPPTPAYVPDDPGARQAQNMARSMSATEGAMEDLYNSLAARRPVAGMGNTDYAAAERLFTEAVSAAPDNSQAFRNLAMLLADKGRWTEVALAARHRLQRLPDDAWAWLALGLAQQRSGGSAAAALSFDSALVRFDATERSHLFGLRRVLRPGDSIAFQSTDDLTRAGKDHQFWMQARPLWSDSAATPRTEYLARVTFAELRWSVDEIGVRGADTDRGDIHIRYGPPRLILSSGPGEVIGGKRNRFQCGYEEVVTYWLYPNGFVWVFWGKPTFLTAHVPSEDNVHVAYMTNKFPVDWDNIAGTRFEDVLVRIARFRAPSDSVDLLVATRAPFAAIRAATASNDRVRQDSWLVDSSVARTYHDSLTLDESALKLRTYRVPASTYQYRVEATAPGATVAGKATQWIVARKDTLTGFALRGFGMSDVVLATRVGPSVPAPARWRDFSVTPAFGSLASRGHFALLWENYELNARDGQAIYSVSITLQRERSGVGRIAAAITGALASIVSVDRRDDRVVLQFDRTVSWAPSIVDNIDMALGDTPAGDYRVIVEIRDRTNGRTVATTAKLAIRP